MLIANELDFDRAIDILKNIEGALVVDTETTGLAMFQRENPARMCGIAVGPAFAANTAHDFYFSFRHVEGENLPLHLLKELRSVIDGRTLMGHNYAFDAKILSFEGFRLPPRIIDTIIAAHLCNENEMSFGLKKLGAQYFGEGADVEEKELTAQLKARKLTKGEMWQLPAAIVAPYALKDIELTRKLYAMYAPELARCGLSELFTEVNEFSLALVRIEMRGLALDVEEVGRQIGKIAPRIAETKARIKQLAGEEMNVNSPAQLKTWLKLASTDREALEEALLRSHREELHLLLEYRGLSKAESTYFRPFLQLRDVNDRLHTNYKVHGTVTGRLSSSEPNLQNASRDQIGRAYSVRNCFTTSPGHFLLEADYSAVEPRIAAHYSEDATMRSAFIEGKDFHTTVARSMFKKDTISKEERKSAKDVGLGTLYGMGAHKASKKLGLRHDKNADGTWAAHHTEVWAFYNDELVKVPCHTVDAEFCTAAGKAFIGKFYAGVPELQPFLRRVVDKATTYKYIRNPISQRMRRFTGPRARPFSAPNSLIQSTASDILRRALVALDKLFTGPGDPKMVLTVHDSIVFEIPFGDSALEHVRTIKRVMETTTTLSIPLIVDLKVGLSLGDMVELSCM